MTPLLIIVSLPFIFWIPMVSFHRERFEEAAIRELSDVNATENKKSGIYKYTWPNGSWILTKFAEECCGSSYDTHIIKSSNSRVYISYDIHYCGLEGMGSSLGAFLDENAFINYIIEKGAKVANRLQDNG